MRADPAGLIKNFSQSLGKKKAGGRYAADLVWQLPARGSGSVALHLPISSLIGSTGRQVKPLHAGTVTLCRGRLAHLSQMESTIR